MPTPSIIGEMPELDGLITAEIGETLSRYAAQVPDGQAVIELGSYRGMSTCYLARGTDNPVYAVDAWNLPDNREGRFGYKTVETRQAFRDQTAGYFNVIPIQGYSDEVGKTWASETVGLLFVDADHHYESVMADVNAWVKHLDPKGVVILDDYDTPNNPGVKRAAEDLVVLLGPYTVEATRLAVFAP